MATAKNIYKNILKQLQYLPGWGEYINVSFLTSDYATVVTKRMQSTKIKKVHGTLSQSLEINRNIQLTEIPNI